MKADRLRLMFVLAHPDDETLGMGGAIARYAAEGVETYLVTATRGEKGWFGAPEAYPGPEALGRIREAELRAAAGVLGLRDVHFLDYIDGELDEADHDEAIGKIVQRIREVRPHVVATFAHDGLYGHPDHIAISQFTTAAVVAAADPTYPAGGSVPHRVAKLYYRAMHNDDVARYERAFGELVMEIDGIERRSPGWEPWVITTHVDAQDHWRRVWQAVQQHRSQLPAYERLRELPEDFHRDMWGKQTYYRVFSTVNGGRALETDFFAGLRQPRSISEPESTFA